MRRSAVSRHSGDIRLAGSDDGTMVSRIHAADIVGVVEASIEQPEAGMVMNVADDLPSTRYEVNHVIARAVRQRAGTSCWDACSRGPRNEVTTCPVSTHQTSAKDDVIRAVCRRLGRPRFGRFGIGLYTRVFHLPLVDVVFE